MLTQLAHAESTLEQCEFIHREEDWPPAPDHLEQLRQWVAALDKLRQESHRLIETAAAKGILPAKPPPSETGPAADAAGSPSTAAPAATPEQAESSPPAETDEASTAV